MRARISRFILLAYAPRPRRHYQYHHRPPYDSMKSFVYARAADNTPAYLPYNKARCTLHAGTIPRRRIIVMGDLTCLHRIFPDAIPRKRLRASVPRARTVSGLSVSPRVTGYRQPDICHCVCDLSLKRCRLSYLCVLIANYCVVSRASSFTSNCLIRCRNYKENRAFAVISPSLSLSRDYYSQKLLLLED